jgi:sugar O-acyltransferase (sialic acid O-acetyltransferase NeuD family)
MRSIIIIGAGGHGCIVADALLAAGCDVLGFVDNDKSRVGETLLGLPILGDDSVLASIDRGNVEIAIGVGGTGAGNGLQIRDRIAEFHRHTGWTIAGVRHPQSIIAASANVADDAQIMARATIQPMARIGAGAIINTAAIVEHHCLVGANSHVSIGAILCGGVVIGQNVHVGAGSVVRQGVTVGDDVVIGAGAAVVSDQLHASIIMGVPAKEWSRA